MTWEEVRAKFPHQWVVVEATDARTESGLRRVEDVAVVEIAPSGEDAWRTYRELHRQNPQREYIPLHTDRQSLEFEELAWVGVRPQP